MGLLTFAGGLDVSLNRSQGYQHPFVQKSLTPLNSPGHFGGLTAHPHRLRVGREDRRVPDGQRSAADVHRARGDGRHQSEEESGRELGREHGG